MNLTKEQRDAVKYEGNALIVACPGSGKTRTLVAKLLYCLDEIRESSRKIACLTYTNTAVYEIEDRLRKYGRCGDEEYCDVSTIHSFCLVNILNNFYWRIPEYSNGFSVITPDNEEFQRIATNVLGEFGLDSQFRDYFESFNRELDGRPVVPEDIDPEIAMEFWQRLRLRGFIDFPNIIYYAYRLINEMPSVAYALSCKYAWLLVDEFQDTTALQVEILRKISNVGHTKFFLVGDPYQSIYGFAGARVELMETFGQEIAAKRDFQLLANWRSSKLIIDHAEKLCPRTPQMYGVGKTANDDIKPLYVHTSTAFEGITDFFLPIIEERGIGYGESAIVSPWWVKLLQVGRSLRDYGIPIVGPGARPYKRSHIFALLAEQICAYISHPEHKTFHQIGKELFILVNGISKAKIYHIFSYDGNVIIYRLIDTGSKIRDKNPSAVDWLMMASEEFEDILVKEGLIKQESKGILKESAKCIKEDMIKNRVDVENLSVEDLGLFASTARNLHLLTMHRAKGREFDAVAIIDCHDGRIPDFRAVKKRDLKRIEEARRLLYVSITRARRFLLYITDDEDCRLEPSRFICESYLDLERHN